MFKGPQQHCISQECSISYRYIPVPLLALRLLGGGAGGRPTAHAPGSAHLRQEQGAAPRVLGCPAGEGIRQVSPAQEVQLSVRLYGIAI